jgi:3-isopropylmalate dehydratase small subunit
VRHPDGLTVPFALDPYDQETLVHGLDDIARTLQLEGAISAYEARNPGRFDALALP